MFQRLHHFVSLTGINIHWFGIVKLYPTKEKKVKSCFRAKQAVFVSRQLKHPYYFHGTIIRMQKTEWYAKHRKSVSQFNLMLKSMKCVTMFMLKSANYGSLAKNWTSQFICAKL